MSTQADAGAKHEALRKRHRALQAIRAFFDGQGFVEVETPAIVRSPGLEVHLDAFEVLGAGAPRFLHTSPEYHMKRLLAGGMERIYQLGKAFRRGELGHQHQPEFCMLEWYRRDAGSTEMMRDTEQLVAAAAQALCGGTTIPARGTPVEVAPPWQRITVREAFREHGGVDVDTLLHDEDAFFRVLVDHVEPALGHGRPTFLTDYPARFASLARLNPHDPSTADRFEAYVAGVELCNGFGELLDAAEQRRRLEADLRARKQLGKPAYPIDELFLQALESEIPESGGNALGVDRLMMLLLGAERIDEVVAFGASQV
jgi:lysyl-tRNA synthetase class 2